jgi:hypothetical protein
LRDPNVQHTNVQQAAHQTQRAAYNKMQHAAYNKMRRAAYNKMQHAAYNKMQHAAEQIDALRPTAAAGPTLTQWHARTLPSGSVSNWYLQAHRVRFRTREWAKWERAKWERAKWERAKWERG